MKAVVIIAALLALTTCTLHGPIAIDATYPGYFRITVSLVRAGISALWVPEILAAFWRILLPPSSSRWRIRYEGPSRRISRPCLVQCGGTETAKAAEGGCGLRGGIPGRQPGRDGGKIV